MALTAPAPSVLTDDLLGLCQQRAAVYDRENRFFHEDFDALRQAGYLLSAVPTEFGGLGLSLADVCQEQRRLAYYAPATALGVNMHILATGIAADLYRRGDASQEWLLREAVAGEVFAYGHAEVGNDLPVLYSTSRAERVAGGYRFTGRKMFGSLTPVWTRFCMHAMDASDPTDPKVVHAFMPRDTSGYRIEATWDTLGMRATRSDDTILEGAFVPDQYVARVVSAGFGGADLFVLAIFAWGELTFGNVYVGIAQRARDLAVSAAQRRTSIGLGRSMAYHPEVQHAVAEIALELEAMIPHVDRVAEDWSTGVEHGSAWPAKLVAAKYHCVGGAKRIVDRSMDVNGGASIFRVNELQRLYRDVQCGGFHPANAALVYEIVGKTALGIDPGEQPRWG
jgi:alkylation response protein AidB-like acyl-CoA dehydrogenase